MPDLGQTIMSSPCKLHMLCRAQKCYQVCQPGGIQAWEILKPCVYPETTLSVQHPGAAVREWEGCVEALLTKPRWVLSAFQLKSYCQLPPHSRWLMSCSLLTCHTIFRGRHKAFTDAGASPCPAHQLSSRAPASFGGG